MKKLLILLLLCICVFACDDMQKPVTDIIGDIVIPDDIVVPPEEQFADVPRLTVYDALWQGKITGPWLWMIAETDPWRGGNTPIDVDSLAIASEGAVRETDVATNGVAADDMIADLTWTLGTIGATDEYADDGNVDNLISKIGLSEGNLDHYSAYGLINLVSDTDRPNLTMRVGSDDSIKVWLNGGVVHKNPAFRPAFDFQDEFKVDLKMGNNLLLVKVSDYSGGWTMFVGIEDPTIEIPIPETTAPEIPEITFENVLFLREGKRYRLRPTRLDFTTDRWGDIVLSSVIWGNIGFDFEFVERSDFPVDAPKIRLNIQFYDRKPYFYTRDGDPVINHTVINRQPISDEIVVEIKYRRWAGDERGGDRGEKFDFKHIAYESIIIENLTRPDVIFEYE